MRSRVLTAIIALLAAAFTNTANSQESIVAVKDAVDFRIRATIPDGRGTPGAEYTDDGVRVYLIWSNGRIGNAFLFPESGTYRFVVNARGSSARSVWPEMQVLVDGKVAETIVDSDQLDNYTFDLEVSKGWRVVSIAFTNDIRTRREDRNLFVRSLRIERSVASTPTPTPTPTPAPTPDPEPPANNETVIFSDNFESGNFDKWSYAQGLNRSEGPGPDYVYVRTNSSMGIPSVDGNYAAHFQRPQGSNPHAKVFKEWSQVGKRDRFGKVEERFPNGGNPTGTYSAWYYFPSNYSPADGWVNIFQFKEEGYINGVWNQLPSWWINVSRAAAWGSGGNEPVLFANHWKVNYNTFRPKTVPVPRGRWFEIKAVLVENSHIDWYIDGKLFDTSRDSTWPVGRYYDQSNGWIFGIGHYGAIGTVYIDKVRVSVPD